MQDPMNSSIAQMLMFSLMFGMGLALTVQDFRRVLSVRTPVLTGMGLQLFLMPVVGGALAVFFDLPPLLGLGMVVCAALPGGAGSNLLVHFGRAHTALSITLTATATFAALFTLPLWIRGAQSWLGAEAETVVVPVLDTALQLGILTVLPVALGMLVREGYPGAASYERWVTGISGLALLAVMVWDSADQPEAPLALLGQSFLPVLCLAILGMLVGVVVPLIFGQTLEDAVTIAIELCVKNVLLGMVVLASAFSQIDPNVPLFVYSGVMMPAALLLLVGFRARLRWVGAAARTS